jgi:hypothetical protein
MGDRKLQPVEVSSLKEVVERDKRIQQLEKLNATLAAEVDRMRPVVEAAVEWRRDGYERKADFCVGINPLLDAIDIYDVGIKRPW